MIIYEIDHVVTFELNDKKDHIEIVEQCDNYYAVTVKKQEFKLIIEELTRLYEQMI